MIIADVFLFFGRFHPVVLHLPIGILVLLALYVLFVDRCNVELVKKGLWIGLVATTITVIFGLILATEGGYNASTLSWHKFLGFGLLTMQLILLVAFARPLPLKIRRWLFVITIAVLTLTGHFGANLTHGENYLTEHIPVSRVSSEGSMEEQPVISNVDSAFVFPQLIYPIFKHRCISCHNRGKQKGALMLTSYEALMQGSAHGVSVLPGEPELSELLRRVRLPVGHPAAMPPEGKQPLQSDEIAVIEWWIENGAKDSVMVSELPVSVPMKAIMQRITGGKTDAPFRVKAPELDSARLLLARNAGWDLKLISQGSNALRVKALRTGAEVEALDGMEANIHELDLSDRTIDGDTDEFLSKCTNLSVLNLSACKNVVTALNSMAKDKVIALILNQSDVADLSLLTGFEQLERLYIVEADIKKSQVEQFTSDHPEVQVISERFSFDKESI